MDKLVKIDADLTLKQTEQRCEAEQQMGFQLDIVKFGTLVEGNNVFPVNKAEFNFESSVKILDQLTFVEAGNNNPDTITQQMTAQNHTFICDTQIFVQKHIRRVLIFGKKS